MASAFGRYEILEKLAAGGMAEVYRARAFGADGFVKELVVKKILPSRSADASFRKMFVDEAKITVGLTHTNIVQVFDFGKVDDTYFLAMEKVEGIDLRRLLARAEERGLHMPTAVALHIVAETLKGLDYAHRRTDATGRPLRIVHRDVSPANILLSFEGEVKIADFGIARAVTKGDPFDGQVVGKPRYMSPEQIQDLEVDGRSDVFACGVVLHELLTGRQPFETREDGDTFAQILSGKLPKPSDSGAFVPGDLDPIVLTALKARPSERYPSAAAMADAIQDYALDHRLKLGPGPVAEFLKLCGVQPEITDFEDPPPHGTREVTVLAQIGTGEEIAQFTQQPIADTDLDGSLAAASRSRPPLATPSADTREPKRPGRALTLALGAAALLVVGGAIAIGAAHVLSPTPAPLSSTPTAPPTLALAPSPAATAATPAPTATRLAIAATTTTPTPRRHPTPHATSTTVALASTPAPTPAATAATLPSGPGFLLLMSDPAGGEVFVDGKDTGKRTPIYASPLSLAPGAHAIRIVGTGETGLAISATFDVTIRSGETVKRGGVVLK